MKAFANAKSWANKGKFAKERLQVEKLEAYLAKCEMEFGPIEDLIDGQVVVLRTAEKKLKAAREKLVRATLDSAPAYLASP
jgi:hypothetical protein